LSLGETLGFIAGALVTCSLIPQLVRVFKLKSAREISTLFTTMLLLGILIWLAYGIFLGLTPVILWNATGAALVATLLYLKLRYGR
jgi:MtN3 and saliva related transmembrane protein